MDNALLKLAVWLVDAAYKVNSRTAHKLLLRAAAKLIHAAYKVTKAKETRGKVPRCP